jgi:hypothetical protein
MAAARGEETLARLAAVVRERLGASAAHFEVGGDPPADDGRTAWAAVDDGPVRIVARFETAIADRAGTASRLTTMVQAFGALVAASFGRPAGEDAPAVRTGRPSVAHVLDEVLGGLSDAAGALSAIVLDSSSPVLWGKSHASLALGPADGALAALFELDGCWRRVAAGARPADAAGQLRLLQALAEPLRSRMPAEPGEIDRLLHTGRTAAAVRSLLARAALQGRLPLGRSLDRGDGHGHFARGVAGVYALALSFAAPFSEIRVDGAVRRAIDGIEHLLAVMPPLAPPPEKGGAGSRVVTLRKT